MQRLIGREQIRYYARDMFGEHPSTSRCSSAVMVRAVHALVLCSVSRAIVCAVHGVLCGGIVCDCKPVC